MTELEIRTMIAEALDYASVFVFQDKGLGPKFIAGEADATLAELEMDSLATMELCIAIEANAGVSVLPAELEKIGTLGDLVKVIGERAS
jgi:acyl carrier protein